MSIRPDFLDDIEELARTNSDLNEVAVKLVHYVETSAIPNRKNLTSKNILQAFIDRYEDDLSAIHRDFLGELIRQDVNVADDLVVVQELTPSTDDPHNITSFLADGGIGRVWLARDEQVQREVVLKQLLPSYQDSEGAKTRFVHEAQVTGSLQHPNIVPVYSMNWDNGDSPFYTMKYIRGETLAIKLKAHHQTTQGNEKTFQLLLSSFLSVCQAIAYAHEQGVIHRDLKPDNIAIGEFGEVTVLDWGLAANVQDEAADQVTTGVYGTPNYMPPEQASAEGITDKYSDIYSVGAILFEILCGSPPRHPSFQTQGLNILLQSIIAGNIPDATEQCPGHLKGLGHIANKCLHLEPGARYLTITDLIDDIHAWENDRAITARPDTVLQSFNRRIRRNRRALIASSILLPFITFVLVGFISQYNIRYANLATAKQSEVLKQEEQLQTKQQLANAIKQSAQAKLDAEANTQLAKQNYQLANESRVTYRQEQTLAEKSKNENLAATRNANEAELRSIKSTQKRLSARVIADDSKAAAVLLANQIQLQVFDTLTLNADNSASNLQFNHAQAWTSAALQQASRAKLEPQLLQQQRVKYNALNTRIPRLDSVKAQTVSGLPLLHDATSDVFYIATTDNSTAQPSTIVEKRSVRTLKTIWKGAISGACIAHAHHAASATYCVVYESSPNLGEVAFYDDHSGELKLAGTIQLRSPPNTLYLTSDRLIFIEEYGLSIYDRQSLGLIHRTPLSKHPIYASTISEGASRIATIHGRHTLRLWDTTEGLLLSKPLQSKHAIIGLTFHPVSKHLEVVMANGEQLRLDAESFTPKRLRTSLLPLSQDETITHAVFHRHQLLTAYGTSFGRVFISNASGSLTIAPMEFPEQITGLSLSPDQRMLLIQSGVYTANLFDINQRKFIVRNLEHPSKILGLALSNNNRFLLGTLEAGEIRKWDLATPSNPPAIISLGTNYVYSQFYKHLIISVTVTGQIEFRNGLPPFEVQSTSEDPLLIQADDEWIPYNAGLFIVGGQRLVHVSYEDQRITHEHHILPGPVSAFTVNNHTGSLAIAHSDRTISIYTPKANQPFKRMEGFKVSYEDIIWQSPETLIAMFADADQQTTILDQLVIGQDKFTNRTTLSGTGYQFLHDTKQSPLLVDNNGVVFEPTANGNYLPVDAFTTGLQETRSRNPTVAFTSDGLAQQIHEGTLLRYDVVMPEDITATTASGYFALLSDESVTIHRIGSPKAYSTPIDLRMTPNAIDLEENSGNTRLLAATSSGIRVYDLRNANRSASEILIESAVLAGMSTRNNANLERSNLDVLDAYHALPQSSPSEPFNPIEWLIAHSSQIESERWSALLAARKSRWENATNPTSQEASQLVDKLVLAQIGSQQYSDAVNTLLQGFSQSKQKRHLYQACMLSVWLQDESLCEDSLVIFQANADLTVPQEFVYFSLVAGLSNSSLDYQELDAFYNRLKNTKTTNPVVLRALLINAVRLQDATNVQIYLQRLIRSRAPIPIRDSSLAFALNNAPTDMTNMPLVNNLRHSKSLTPSLSEGNPGINWPERCLFEIALRDLEQHYEVDGNE